MDPIFNTAPYAPVVRRQVRRPCAGREGACFNVWARVVSGRSTLISRGTAEDSLLVQCHQSGSRILLLSWLEDGQWMFFPIWIPGLDRHQRTDLNSKRFNAYPEDLPGQFGGQVVGADGVDAALVAVFEMGA